MGNYTLSDIVEMTDEQLAEIDLLPEHRILAKEKLEEAIPGNEGEESPILSLRAFGLYVLMATRGKTISAEMASSHVKEGIDAVKTAMRELRAAGVVHSTRAKFHDTGQYRGIQSFLPKSKWDVIIIGDLYASMSEIYELFVAKMVEDRW